MTEQLNTNRGDKEPFYQPTERIRTGTFSDIKKFQNDDRYVVRVEPSMRIPSREFLNSFENTLQDFAKTTGLKVPNNWLVKAKAKYESGSPRSVVKDNDGEYVALYRVVESVDGINASDKLVPTDQRVRLVSSLFHYFKNNWQLDKPFIPEVRPTQFIYGHTKTNSQLDFYMVDLDYSWEQSTAEADVIKAVLDCFSYIRYMGLNVQFQTIAKEMLDFIRRPQARIAIARGEGTYPRLQLEQFDKYLAHAESDFLKLSQIN